MLSVEQRELAKIVGFVSDLAKSFGVEIAGVTDGNKAKGAANGFGDAAGAAGELTEAARLEAERAAAGGGVNADSAKKAADALAKKLGLDRTDEEGSMEALLN